MLQTAPFLWLALWAQEGAVSFSDPAREAARLRQAIERQPEVEANYTGLGNLLLRTQNFPQAAAVLEAARARFPSSAQAALSLGVAYYGQRKFPEAVAAFIETAKLDGDIEQPIAFLSRLSEHWADRKDEITALFRAFVARQPSSATGQFALGKATAGSAALSRAIALNPRHGEAYFELGGVQEAARQYTAAIASFQKAAQLNPANPAPHYRLARLYARLGDKVGAERERGLHEKLLAAEKAEVDRRQAATRHLSFEGEKK